MYAIIEACGKQYKAAQGDIIFFEKLDTEVEKVIKFDKIVLISNDDKIEIGNPYVKGAIVEGKVLSHGKGKKIIVFKYKPKKNYKRKQGHRQPYTKVEILAIKLEEAKKTTTKAEVADKETVKEVKPAKTTTKEETTEKPKSEKTTVKKEATKTAAKKEEAKTTAAKATTKNVNRKE